VTLRRIFAINSRCAKSDGAGQRGKIVDLAGISVLVAEDEALVAMNLEDMLSGLGCSVVGPAIQFDEAERLVERADCKVAILDVNLGGRKVFPLAGRLKERGVALVFATGYGRDELPEEWRGESVLEKPYSVEDVAERLASALGGH